MATTSNGPGGSGGTISDLAALSARNSLKRSRVLFAVNPQSAFIPSEDPTITQAALNRRKRRVAAQQQPNSHANQSNALVVATSQENDAGLQMKPVSRVDNSTALTISGSTEKIDSNDNSNNSNKGGGILVVSSEFLYDSLRSCA